MEEYTLSDIFEKPISGEWGKELLQGEMGTKVIRTTNFTNLGRLDLQDVVERNIDLKKYKNKILKFGDIIIEKSGGSPTQPVGRVVIFDIKDDEEYVCNNFTAILRPKKLIYPKYSLYLLKDLYNKRVVLKFQNKTTGIINLKLNNYISKTKVTLPNLDDQKKIADILDKSQELIDKRKSQIEALDELVKSGFIEMFGDPVINPKNWPKGTVRDIVTEVKYGTSKPAVEGGKYKYLRMNNITYNGQLDIRNLKYINIPEKDIEKCIVRKGDVLFNRTNSKELVGKTCVFNLDEPMVIAGYIIRVRMNEKALPEYLAAILNSKYGKDVLYGMCKAIVGQANINAQELQDIKIFIPPIELQKQYVEFLKHIDKLKFEMQKNLKEMENNFSSLMQRAFKGELFNNKL